MDIIRVDLASVCHRDANLALAIIRTWWQASGYHDPKECNFFEPFGPPLLHVDLGQLWANPGDCGGG